MSWICIRRFPLEQNLQSVSQFLNQNKVPHRFTEEGGEQCLWAPNAEVGQFIEGLLAKIESESLDLAPEIAKTEASNFQSQFSWTYFFKSNYLSLITIFLGFLGFLVDFLGADALRSALLFVPREIYYSWQGGKSLTYIVENMEFWRVLTPAFLHFGIWHILMNSMCIMLIGFRLEKYLNARQYIVLFLFLAIASNLIQFFTGDTPFFGGLSGVVYGYFGFALIIQKFAPNPLVHLPNGIYVWMIAWLAIGITNITGVLFSVYMANGAHLGGLLAGIVAAFLYLKIYGSARSEEIVGEFEKIQAQLRTEQGKVRD